jgi:hypothetical protein
MMEAAAAAAAARVSVATVMVRVLPAVDPYRYCQKNFDYFSEKMLKQKRKSKMPIMMMRLQ